MIDKITQARYSTFIPTLYHQRKEHLLPLEFRQEIPHSTASTWRNQTYMHFKESQFLYMQQEGIEWYELFLERQKLKRTVQALCRVWIALTPILKPVLQARQHTFAAPAICYIAIYLALDIKELVLLITNA